MSKDLTTNNKAGVLSTMQQGLNNLVVAIKEEAALAKQFSEANADFGVDRFDSIVYINKNNRGQIIEKTEDGENILGESINAILVKGFDMYQIWPKGQPRPLVKAETKDEAIQALYAGQDAGDERYTNLDESDIASGYVLDLVLLNDRDMEALKTGGSFESPQLRRLNLTITSKIKFNDYSAKLFRGGFTGFPKGTTVSTVITNIMTVDAENKNKEKYIKFDFKPVTI